MANLQGLLGTMLATGLAGRSRRGPAFAASPFGGLGGLARGGRRGGMGMGGGGLPQAAGLAALGYLAYKAYQEHQAGRPPSGAAAGEVGAGSPAAPRGRGGHGGGDRPSLGERLAGMLRPGEAEPEPAPEPALEDRRALLLIRAMIAAANADGEIAAANADGEIAADERRRILATLDEAEAGPEEREVLERELARPRSVDEIAREVGDGEAAEQVYLASRIAMDPDTPAEQAYLQYLAARLNLAPDRVEALRSVA